MTTPHPDGPTTIAHRPDTDRDIFGTIALCAAAVSLAGFAVLIIGHLIDPGGFNNGKHPNAANNVAFFAYVLGLLIALLLGGTVWFYARRAGRGDTRSPAALATYYGVTFLIVAIVFGALGLG